MHRDTQRGFTVIELLAVVAIVAILAAVVVPQFMQDSTRGQAKSEVSPTFAEISTRQEQYKTEQGVYLSATACPASASSAGTKLDATPCTDTTWTTLRVQWPERTLSCSYLVTHGASTDVPTAGAGWPSWATAKITSTPGTSWYFIKAVCPATEYIMASWDPKIQSKDGK